MTYAVKEIFYTLQGEGGQAGRAAVFCRFAGCNLWSGLERDRAAAVCTFCDTDFVGTDGEGGGKFRTVDALADAVAAQWPVGQGGTPYVVCTGGEPLLQLDEALIAALHARGFEIAVETNGTIVAPDGIDWICLSPKASAPLAQIAGSELKLVYPQAEAMPERFAGLNFPHFFLQPMDGPDRAANTEAATRYCMDHPQWRLSLQTHKILAIPSRHLTKVATTALAGQIRCNLGVSSESQVFDPFNQSKPIDSRLGRKTWQRRALVSQPAFSRMPPNSAILGDRA